MELTMPHAGIPDGVTSAQWPPPSAVRFTRPSSGPTQMTAVSSGAGGLPCHLVEERHRSAESAAGHAAPGSRLRHHEISLGPARRKPVPLLDRAVCAAARDLDGAVVLLLAVDVVREALVCREVVE